MTDLTRNWDKAPWKRARKRAIGWQESERIVGKLAESDKSADAVKAIAAEHQLSQLTIRRLAKAHNIMVAQ